MIFDANEAVQISVGLVKAIAEANVLARSKDFGPVLQQAVRYARQLHDLLREQLSAESPVPFAWLDALCAAQASNVQELEELVRLASFGRRVEQEPIFGTSWHANGDGGQKHASVSRLPIVRNRCRDNVRSRQRLAILGLRRTSRPASAP